MAVCADCPAEPAFFLERWSCLQPVPQLDAARSWAFLSREVHRRPQRLALHLCRIRVALALDAEAVYAALVDLVLALDGRGRRLQRRMVLGAGRWLDPARRTALQHCLAGELAPASLPFSPRAVLQTGAIGRVADARSADTAPKPVDWLTAARDCLALGQLEQAQALYERKLLAEPGCAPAREALLEIYRALGDRDGFLRLHDHLRRHDCLDPAWERHRAEVER